MSLLFILICLGAGLLGGAFYCIAKDGARRDAAQMAAWRRMCDEYERAAKANDPCAEFTRKQMIMAEMFDGDGMERKGKGWD